MVIVVVAVYRFPVLLQVVVALSQAVQEFPISVAPTLSLSQVLGAPVHPLAGGFPPYTVANAL